MPNCTHFEICQEPSLRNSEFCILHSPEPNKDEAEFEKGLSQLLSKQKSDYRYITFSRSFNGMRRLFGDTRSWHVAFDFSNVTFLGKTDFGEFKYEKGANFSNAIFANDANFRRASFSGPVDFSETTFRDDVFCNHATFEGGADFHRTKFEAMADFGDSRFMQSANFALANFAATARFCFCRFEAVEFLETVFHDYADFTCAEFGGRTGFTFAQFHADVSFEQAKFKEIATFRGKPGESNFFNEANFESVLLTRPNILRFIDVDCSQTRFLGADVILMTFDGVEWCPVSKTRCGIYDELLQKRNEEFFSITDVEQLYRSLKQNYEGRRDLARAGDFHIGEKEMRLKNPSTPANLRILLWLSKVFSGYGESYLRPLFWFFALLFGGSFLVMLSGLTYRGTRRPLSLSSVFDWSQVMGFVFARAIHLDKEVAWFEPTTLPNTVGLWAGVLGPIFGALLVLGIRNRLKR